MANVFSNLTYDQVFGESAPKAEAPPKRAPTVFSNVTYEQVFGKPDPSKDTELRQSLMGAVATTPDQAAKAVRLSRQTGAPLEAVESNLQQVEREAALQEYLRQTDATTYTAQFLRKMSNAKIARDDINVLTSVESKLGSFKGPEPSFASVFGGLGEALKFKPLLANMRLAFHDAFFSGNTPDDQFRRNDLLRKSAQAQAQQDNATPAFESDTAKGVYSGAVSLVQNLPGVAASVATGSPVPALALAGANTGFPAYGKYIERGASKGMAALGAAGEGAVEIGTEILPTGFLVNRFGKVGAGQFLRGFLGRELPSEQAATLAQDAIDTAIANPSKTQADYWHERPDAAYQTLIATLTQSGVMGGVHAAARRMQGNDTQAQQAEATKQSLLALGEQAQESKLAKRDPETFRQFVQEASKDGPVDTLYIDGKALMASGIANEVAALSPSVASQMDQAALGGWVSVPLAEYGASLSTSPYYAQLAEHTTTDPDNRTPAQWAEYKQTPDAQRLEQEISQMLDKQTAEKPFSDSVQAVRQQIADQLTATGRYGKDAVQSYAELPARFVAVQAARLGITPEAFFAQHPLTITGEPLVGGAQYAQAAPVATITGSEIAPADSTDHAARREATKDWYAKTLAGTSVVNTASGKTIQFGKAKKAFSSSAKPEKLQLFAALQDVLAHGTIERSTAPVDPAREPNVKAYHWLTAPVSLNGQTVNVGVTIREDNHGNLYYNHNPVPESAKASETPELTNTAHEAGGGTKTPEAFAQSIAADSNDINLHLLNQQQGTTRGTFAPDTNTITLLKEANWSTFLHETGHWFLETEMRMAVQLAHDQQIFGQATNKAGENEILQDAQTLLDWFGVQSIQEWESLGFEEKTTYHEKFARGFEKYNFYGQSPSLEMHGIFQRFSAWLVSVYKSIKAFADVDLTPEVSQVMDRMIASREQIQAAQQSRSMMPMFETLESSGMTPEAYQAYHQLDVDAQADAIESVQQKELRDMALLRNTHQRVVQELKAKYKATRAVTEMEVRREVMQRPLYQAWSWLTGKMTADDKLADTAPKSDPNILEPEMDSLFVAVAKLGGLNKDEVLSTWGIDPADKPQAGLFGKPVWRVENGGHSIDGMAELLGQYGYLEQDENGRVDLREFEEKFGAELRGDAQHSNQYNPALFAPVRGGEQVVNPEGIQAGRFDAAALREIGLPEEIIDHLRNLKMVSNNGWHPDIVAERYGFESGDDLARTLASAPTPNEEITGLTDALMLERHGEIATPEAILREADRAIANEQRHKMMWLEHKRLSELAGKATLLLPVAKEFAANQVAQRRVRDLRPHEFSSAAARAGKLAQKAYRDGDYAAAASEKRNQLLWSVTARAAYDAQAEFESAATFFSKVNNARDENVGKTRDMDIVNAARAMLSGFGYGGKAKRAQEYLARLESYDPDTFRIVNTSLQAVESIAHDARPQDGKPLTIKDLTVQQLRQVRDEVDALWTIAKSSRQIEIDGKQVDRKAAVGEIVTRLNAIADTEEAQRQEAFKKKNPGLKVPDKKTPGKEEAITRGENLLREFQSAIAAGRRVEAWAEKMDGGTHIGPFQRYIFQPIKQAAVRYQTDKATYIKRFRELFDGIAPTLKQGQINAKEELNYTFGKDSGGVGMNELLHALLHTGNESNKRKLLLGRGWATELPDGSLDTSRWDAFIQRMIDEKRLTKAHFDFVQSVWDLLEETKPLAQKAHRAVFGKYFDEVSANAFSTPFGDYRGGYAPAVVDTRIVLDGQARALAQAGNDSMTHAFPTTNKGFTKSRVEYNQPLLLDLRSLPQHIDKVLLFSHMETAVRGVRGVLMAVQSDLNRADHTAINHILTPWLNRSARQQVTAPAEMAGLLGKVTNYVRSTVGMSAMLANVSNAVQQVSSFPLAAVQIGDGGTKALLAATAQYAQGPKAFAKAVAEASPYMANRMSSELQAAQDAVEALVIDPNPMQKAEAWARQNAYFLQTAVDNSMGPIIWQASYDTAIARNESHDDAVKIADRDVRNSMGALQAEDVSRIESGGPLLRALMQFYSYFNMWANTLATSYGNQKNWKGKAWVTLVGFVATSAVAEAIAVAFRGGPDDADKDGEYLDDWLAAVFGFGLLKSGFAMVPGFGQFAMAGVNMLNKNPNDDRVSVSPIVGAGESTVKVAMSVFSEEARKHTTARDVGTFLSLITGNPVFGALARPVGYGLKANDGRVSPTGPVDAARGFVTGTASPASQGR